MAKLANSQSEMDERFLLQSLQRLRTPGQRYVFTLIADLISQGLAAIDAQKKSRKTKHRRK